ncbi:uncharacterized protein [Procambarus clarkii]|uniref:uncharacterized protein n=1 Tax=Procambarus clarkii TaxID=6728 RepID=UPI00374339FC
MEQDHSWPRGRHGWNSDGLGLGLREGDNHSPRRMHHSGSPSHKFRPNRPVWDDTVHDLASMRLTPAELARKLAARQSSNKVIARAHLLEQSRRTGSYSPNLPPSLAARLQAARQQSVDSILAQSNAMLIASQRVRQMDTRSSPDFKAMQQQRKPDGEEDVKLNENDGKQNDGPTKTSLLPDSADSSTSNQIRTSGVDTKDETCKSQNPESKTETSGSTLNELKQKIPEDLLKQRARSSSSTRDVRKPLDTIQGAATRTSLDHTITMVVNTCRELWLQLEEERLTRERLQQQLQQQGNVITTLTAELLQIQDQQEAILREVSDARASGLWGAEGDISGGSTDVGEDLASIQTASGRLTGSRPSPQSLSSRHPQRSILRATRTITPPHMRQPPPYQVLQQTTRTHQTDSHLPLSLQLPPSPRPHQPSRSHSQSPQAHQPSACPTSETSLSQGSFMGGRPEIRSHSSYRSSISRQIRDALINDQIATNLSDGKALSTPSNFAKLQLEGSSDVKSSEKDIRAKVDKQAVTTANKENSLISVEHDGVMDSTITELLEKKN